VMAILLEYTHGATFTNLVVRKMSFG